MTSKQSSDNSVHRDDQDVVWRLERSPHEVFLDRFRLAEDHFNSTKLANGDTFKRRQQRIAPIQENKNETLQHDEGLRRTIDRAKKIDPSFLSNKSQNKKSKNSKNTREMLSLEDTIEYDPHTSIFLPSSRQGKTFNRKTHTKDSESDNQDEENQERAAQALRDRKNKIEIADIRAKMPDESLLEVLQHFGSLYYDKRHILYDSIQSSTEESSATSTEFGMLQACEGNALVAIAIYLEEMVKLQAKTKSLPIDIRSSSPHIAAFQRLNELKRSENGHKIRQRMFKGKHRV
ncbi:hypothetical protein L7F22_027258 [Adiantum nelumboides]|nr:hypothetical protein [Adiantum nelumboides]